MRTFIPAAPSTKWSGSVASVVIELFDKLQIVDEAKTTEPYSKAVGTNVTSTVQAILTSLGQTKMYVSASSATLRTAMPWKPGTKWLTIINEIDRKSVG